MALQASKKCDPPPPGHHHIGSCTSNGIDWEQVSGTCSMLTMSSPSSQASAQSEKKVPDIIFIPVLTEWEFIYGHAEVI